MKTSIRRRRWLMAAGLLALSAAPAAPGAPPQTLRLATTTSTADTGLLDAILPAFQARFDVRVDVIAVGTGQALALGAKGDADVVLVHARAREDAFVAAGDGTSRLDLMYNDFVLVGPKADPAGVAGMATATQALVRIAERKAAFASRGDDSGTHIKEKGLWAAAGLAPTVDGGWYLAIGQGMGETLLFAEERQAYTLTDRGTWLALQSGLPNLIVAVGGDGIDQNQDEGLRNPYGVIPVNPAKHPGVSFALATRFAEWITAVETQERIAAYGVERFGQPLFFPCSAAWQAAKGSR